MGSRRVLGSLPQTGENMIILLLACFAPKFVGTIDQIDNGFCVVEFGNDFHFYDIAVCKGRVEGEKIKVK